MGTIGTTLSPSVNVMVDPSYASNLTKTAAGSDEDARKDPTDLRKNVMRILGVIVGLLKDRVSVSNEPSSKRRRVQEKIGVNHQERLLEDRKTDAFLDKVHKKKVSDEIRQRKREKKLSQSHVLFQDSSSTISELFQADLSMTNTKHALPEQVVKESTPNQSSLVLMEPQKKEEKQVNLSEIKGEKISYNQKVEQDLICELLEFIRCHDSTSLLNSISSKHIPDVPVNVNLTPGSVPHLAHLFNKAEKTGQKEKLRWYYYSEEYEKKVIVLSSENNISDQMDQMARTQIYDEMELYLPSKKREYLR
ncbi:hypothetical protein GLOIN_2v1790949 [Rhizophagus clarus]|uniref:Uncharacterized protein n=1 Tax=Rhizophagus clarus TaxID=94130 RepID=A0A8H3M7M3_9GLOM|nr:hypothetical protein GLOIN_2v1790949 [Rhizophagus clarus]